VPSFAQAIRLRRKLKERVARRGIEIADSIVRLSSVSLLTNGGGALLPVRLVSGRAGVTSVQPLATTFGASADEPEGIERRLRSAPIARVASRPGCARVAGTGWEARQASYDWAIDPQDRS
jgi:hypothetical protein